MFSYEVAEVREYFRKSKKEGKKAYNQINLGYNSIFKKGEKVAILKLAELEELEASSNADVIAELEAKVQSLTEENLQLKEDLQQLEQEKENLVEDYNSRIDKYNKEIKVASDKVIAEKDKHEKELTEVYSKLTNEKDFSKVLLVAIGDLKARSFLARLRNSEPESVKMALELKPKELEAVKKK